MTSNTETQCMTPGVLELLYSICVMESTSKHPTKMYVIPTSLGDISIFRYLMIYIDILLVISSLLFNINIS